jgi:tetratricopeptide (TPR) repeat protein
MNTAIDLAAESYAKTEYAQSITTHLSLLDEFQYVGEELDFNLGLSHQYAEKLDEALGFYDKASISSDGTLASFAINQSGVIHGNKKEYEVALSKFKSALIQDPFNEVARHNYELLARWMQRDKEQKEKDQNKPEPSDFAKRKKAEADRTVEQFRFKEALSLMQEALAQDETVAAYQEFIKSLEEITEINEK